MTSLVLRGDEPPDGRPVVKGGRQRLDVVEHLGAQVVEHLLADPGNENEVGVVGDEVDQCDCKKYTAIMSRPALSPSMMNSLMVNISIRGMDTFAAAYIRTKQYL